MKLLNTFLLAGILAVAVQPVESASRVSPVNKNKASVAIHGYDPVAYFEAGKPVKGSADFSHQTAQASWFFASAANRDLFRSSPERYAPQFGGYCAWAVSKGYTADIDPEAWKIVNDKLYLNYSKSVQRKWEKDMPQRILDATRNWPNLHD
jgi:YHS domain-containing protein